MGCRIGMELIFQYNIDVDRATMVVQPTNVSNELTSSIGAESNIAYNGTSSLYPGAIDEWDAVTVWVVNKIIAWEGYFYICILESTNNEPPNATYWTQL